MLSENLEQAINDQIHFELSAMYAYMAMSAWFEEKNLPGCAVWMTRQATEEQAHAMKLCAHLHDRGGHVRFEAIDKPAADFKSVRNVFEHGLELERTNTANIHTLYELALTEKDYPAQVMLQWFIDEQVEEEKMLGDILAHLDMIQDNPAGLLMFDSQLGRRPAADAADAG